MAFVLAGLLHSLWLRSRVSQVLAIPLDGGRMFRGRPILGENKTLRGFVVMIPAAALAFAAVAIVVSLPRGVPPATLWQLTPAGYAALGAWAGFGFMAGELPNSFVKRRLGILPGQAPASGLTSSNLLHDRSHRLDRRNARRSDGSSSHSVDDMGVGACSRAFDPLVIQLVALPNGR